MADRKGKVFRCKKGKFKGKLVRYHYPNGSKSRKKMVRYKPYLKFHRRRRY